MTITATPVPAPPEARSLCLPERYVQRRENLSRDGNAGPGDFWAPWRLENNLRFQHHVYAWAARLAMRSGARTVLDVGCGPALKLVRHMTPLGAALTGIDQASAIEHARRLSPGPTYIVDDLEAPRAGGLGAYDLVLCADVLEHLVDPSHTLDLIASACSPSTLVVISTPERDRERGRGCLVSLKPEHVREWARAEFVRYLESRGFCVLRSRLFPKADQDPRETRREELDFRRGRAERSAWACHAVLCTRGARPAFDGKRRTEPTER